MTPTSEDRRDVAERLREYSPDVLKDGSLLKTLKDVTGACSWRDVLDRLADLIDPTCEVMEVPDNDEFMVRVVSGFMCKRCGHEAIVERNCDGSAEPPRYCPCCGARVTGEGEG